MIFKVTIASVFVEADDEHHAKHLATRRVDNYEAEEATLVELPSQVPADWIDAIPFGDYENDGDDRTIRQRLDDEYGPLVWK